MEQAQAREALQCAKAQVAVLRELEPGPTTNEQAFQEILALAGMVRKLQTHTASINDDQQRVIWEQRGVWVYEELVALCAERLQNTGEDGGDFWGNVMGLLFTSARMLYESENRFSQTQHELDEMREKQDKVQACSEATNIHDQQTEFGAKVAENQIKLLGNRVKYLEALCMQAGVSVGEGTTDIPGGGVGSGSVGLDDASMMSTSESLEMRTKLVLQQQELQRRVADSRDLSHRLHSAVAEREKFERERNQLTEDCARAKRDVERQAEVIQGMMARAETLVRENQRLELENDEVGTDNRALGHNLKQHAGVIEKLILLNTELMEVSNHRAIIADQRKSGKGGAQTTGPECPVSVPPMVRSNGSVTVAPPADGFDSPSRQGDVDGAWEGEEDGEGFGAEDVKLLLGKGITKAFAFASYIAGRDKKDDKQENRGDQLPDVMVV